MSNLIECDGGPYCEAVRHIHGCFADKGNCDHPSEHVVSAKAAGQPEGQSSPKGIDQLAADVRAGFQSQMREGSKEAAALAELVSRLQAAEATALAEAGETEEHKAALMAAEAQVASLRESNVRALEKKDRWQREAHAAEAQVAALTQERDEWHEIADTHLDTIRAADLRQDALKARVATLTSALEEIAAYYEAEFMEGDKAYQAAIVARRALADTNT